MASTDRPSKFSRLSYDEAWERLEAYEEQYGEEHTLLACHAAFPMIVSPELVNLIHINFLADAGIPWMAEPDFLLSALCKPLGNGLYQIDTVMRQVLQIELVGFVNDAHARLDRLADFLLVYTDHARGRSQRPDVLRAHRWIAYAYRQPQRVLDEMVSLLLRKESKEYAAAGTRLAQQLQVATLFEVVRDPLETRLTATARTAFEQLLEASAVIAHYWYRDTEAAESLLDRAEENSLLAHVAAGLSESAQEAAKHSGLDLETPPLTERMASKFIRRPGSPLDSDIIDGHLFVDRQALRGAIAKLLTNDGDKVLIVNGPPGSGKSYTWVLIRSIENRTGLFRGVYIDLAELPYSGINPEDLVRQIGYAAGWDVRTMPRQAEADARSVNELAAWVADQTRRMPIQLWIVLDGADQVPAPPPTHDLIRQLAENVYLRGLDMRLVLLGYREPLLGSSMHINNVELAALTRQDLRAFIEQWAAAHGMKDGEGVGRAADVVSLEFSEELERNQGRLDILSSLPGRLESLLG